jgi:DNA-binding transcriptional regulator YiaG
MNFVFVEWDVHSAKGEIAREKECVERTNAQGAQIKELRVRARMSIQDLASRMGITKEELSQLERADKIERDVYFHAQSAVEGATE